MVHRFLLYQCLNYVAFKNLCVYIWMHPAQLSTIWDTISQSSLSCWKAVKEYQHRSRIVSCCLHRLATLVIHSFKKHWCTNWCAPCSIIHLVNLKYLSRLLFQGSFMKIGCLIYWESIVNSIPTCTKKCRLYHKFDFLRQYVWNKFTITFKVGTWHLSLTKHFFVFRIYFDRVRDSNSDHSWSLYVFLTDINTYITVHYKKINK